MSVTHRFSLDDKDLVAGLAEARERSVNRKPALRLVARAGVASTRRRFQTGRGPDGEVWQKGRKETGQTLIDSGLLLRSISDRPPTDDAVEWGSNRIYAGIHQNGGVIRPVNGKYLRFGFTGGYATVTSVSIPKRSFLGASEEDKITWSGILVRHVIEPMRGGAS